MARIEIMTNAGAYQVEFPAQDKKVDTIKAVLAKYISGGVFDTEDGAVFLDPNNCKIFSIQIFEETALLEDDSITAPEASSRGGLTFEIINTNYLGNSLKVQVATKPAPKLDAIYLMPLNVNDSDPETVLDKDTLIRVITESTWAADIYRQAVNIKTILPPGPVCSDEMVGEMLDSCIAADLKGRPYKAQQITAKPYFGWKGEK